MLGYTHVSEYAEKQMASAVNSQVDYNPTVGENLDNRIKMLKKELERAEEAKLTLGPLLNMRIRDIRDAMNF